MIDESNHDNLQNPYEPTDFPQLTKDDFNNELLPKPGCLQAIRWPLIVGTPVVLAVTNGIRAFLMTSTGGDFFGFALISNFFIGCVVGGCIGLIVSAAIWLGTRPSSQK